MQIETKIKSETRAVLKNLLPSNYKAFYFGSRVTGTNSSRSDIDIGIIGKMPLPAKVLLKIEEKLDQLPTLYKFDIVDFSKVSKEFKKTSLKNIESIVEKQA